MTNKELKQLQISMLVIAGLFAGLIIGSIITQVRTNAEIRTDQLVLKDQVEEIVDDKRVIQDLISELLSQIESVKAERESLEALRIRLSKGERNVKK